MVTGGECRAGRVVGPGDRKSGRPADVAMVQATNFGDPDNHAQFWPRDGPRVGCIFVEREVSSRQVIVREVASQGAAQMPFAKDEDMIQTLTPNRSNESLCEGVLPRAVGRRRDFSDPHALHSLPERVTVDTVAIAEEIGRRGIVREGVDELLGGPGGGGVLGHVEMQDTAAMVGEHDEDEEDAQTGGRNGEEVDRDEIAEVVSQERSPGLRRG